MMLSFHFGTPYFHLVTISGDGGGRWEDDGVWDQENVKVQNMLNLHLVEETERAAVVVVVPVVGEQTNDKEGKFQMLTLSFVGMVIELVWVDSWWKNCRLESEQTSHNPNDKLKFLFVNIHKQEILEC